MTGCPNASAELTHWLRAGGDHRIAAGVDGLSPYRVAIRERAAFPLGSCSASSPSKRGLHAAARVLSRWRAADDPGVLDRATETQRSRLRTVLDLDPSTRIWWFPSGTDAVYGVTALALGRAPQVHHVVVGARELGSGTLYAAQGRSFSATPPFGTLDVGVPLPGLADRCTAEAVELRDPDGRPRPPDEVDACVVERVEAGLARRARVVVHLVAHTKTGLWGPSLGCAARLADDPRVDVVVDAAQGRLSTGALSRALAHGFAVLFTGSKFYGGPPFSGALLLPPNWGDDPGPLPEAMAAYCTAADLPTAWTRAGLGLQRGHNPGLVLRWAAALAEIEAYHAIPVPDRARVFEAFGRAVAELGQDHSTIEVHPDRRTTHALATGLGSVATVFAFGVRARALDRDAARRLHASIDAAGVHLGQPIALAEGSPHLLRLALGARLVTRHAADPDAGRQRFVDVLGVLAERVDGFVRSCRT